MMKKPKKTPPPPPTGHAVIDDPTETAEAAEARKGPGRPGFYRPEYAAQAKKLYSIMGATDVEVAQFFDVHVNTVKNWIVANPDFAEARGCAKDVADDRVERSLYHRAVGYTFSAVKIFKPAGEDVTMVPYTEHVPPDTTACIFWLKNRRPEQWRDVQKHEHGRAGDFDRMADEELAQEMQREAAELGLVPPETLQ